MKVLLLRPDRAGDALKSLPALRALSSLRPDLEIHILCSKFNFSIFEHEPGIHAHLEPVAADVVVNLLSDIFPETEAVVKTVCAEKRFSVGMGNIKFPNGTPAGRDERLNVADIIAQSIEPRVLQMWSHFPSTPVLSKSDEMEAERALGRKNGRWIAVCPVASHVQRTAPEHTWKHFCKWVFRDKRVDQFFLFTDPTGLPTVELLAKVAAPGRVSIVGPSSFRALGAYLKQMDGVIAVDSGPSHYVRSMGIPLLAVASGGDSDRWLVPSAPRNVLIRRGLFTSHPSAPEIYLAYRRWTARAF